MKEKKKLIYGIVILVICVIGISYAYWNATYRQTGMNKLASSCFSLALTNEADEINLQKQYPITDADGMKLAPFKFTVENTCDIFASYTVSLELLEGSTLGSQYVKAQLNREEPVKLSNTELGTTSITSSVESRILVKGSLGSRDKEDYTLRLWMDEDISIDDTESMNKSLLAKIVINAQPSTYSPVEQGITKLSDAMLANEYQTSVEAAKRKIAAKQAPNFAEVSPTITYKEVHEENSEVVINIDKPHPSLNGNESLGGQNLTDNDQKLIFGYNYSFKATNPPSYTLEDRVAVDPTTITDFQEKDYYFCWGSTKIDNTTGMISTSNSYVNCGTIYKINSITTTTSGTEGTNSYRLRYIIRGYKYSSIEYESDKSEKGLYITDDDYTAITGEPSYYYRGSVNNNYVKFAGFYWRIIRRNGDGSVRLIYNGGKPDQTGDHTQIRDLAFNNLRDNPAYVGYMYGSVLNTSYEQTHANENSSTIKTFLDDWYKTNIYDKGYHEYVADEIFCNDRSTINGNGYTIDIFSNFGPYKRLEQSKNPTLICPQENDKFTTIEATLGNKSLTYPIGLVTADEVAIAGAVTGKYNKSFYLYTGQFYWTMSPSTFTDNNSSANELSFNNLGVTGGYWLTSRNGVRAVLNLKPDVEITSGIGTANDPFVVA